MTVNNSKYNPKTGRRILEVRSHDYQRPLVSTNSPIPHTTSNQKIESTINSNQNNGGINMTPSNKFENTLDELNKRLMNDDNDKKTNKIAMEQPSQISEKEKVPKVEKQNINSPTKEIYFKLPQGNLPTGGNIHALKWINANNYQIIEASA